MGKLIVTMWVTLDGFIAGPNNEMDWVGASYDEAMGRYETDLVNAAGTLVLGRLTYESFAGAWPHVPDSAGASEGEKVYARRLNSMRKVVYSRTLERADWHNSTLQREIRPDEVERLKQEAEQDLVIYGSASIVQALTNLGLIDEYQLLVHPVLLGSGKPLFGNIEERATLRHVRTATHPSGVVLLVHQPAR